MKIAVIMLIAALAVLSQPVSAQHSGTEKGSIIVNFSPETGPYNSGTVIIIIGFTKIETGELSFEELQQVCIELVDANGNVIQRISPDLQCGSTIGFKTQSASYALVRFSEVVRKIPLSP